MFMMAVAFMVEIMEGMRGPPQASQSVLEEESLSKGICETLGGEDYGGGRCICPEKLYPNPACGNHNFQGSPIFDPTDVSPECRCATWRQFLEDLCEHFGAKIGVGLKCVCPAERPLTRACGHFGGGDVPGAFDPIQDSLECRCLSMEDYVENLTLPVEASALRFCSALLEEKLVAAGDAGKAFFDDLHRENLNATLEPCQHALTGAINATEAQEARWANASSQLSEKGSEKDRQYGRMRPVKQDATDPAEKELWEHALSHVCQDECFELLRMMAMEDQKLAKDVGEEVPFAKTCANHVVQHVEAEILGCCARSCGWNGRVCTLWPFFTQEEKVDWDLECCAEMNVLRNSSREHMCNAVLPSRLATAASKYDLVEQSGTDVGKVLIGQNSSLVWTKEGAREAQIGIKFQLPKKKSRVRRGKGIKKEFELVKEAGVREGDKVSMDFLLEHKNVGEEFLRRGFFREVPFSKIFDAGASSVLELKPQNDTCHFGEFSETCPTKFMTTYMKTCQESWMVTEKESFWEILSHPAVGDCNVSSPEYFAAPEECERLTEESKGSFGKTFVHYFTFKKEKKKKPIECIKLGKDQCQGEPFWWKKIPLKSVEELVNEEEVNTYTDLVYVKIVTVKSD